MERTEECLAQLKAWPRTANAPDVIIIIGRTGAGKSSLMEDLTNSPGHAQESPDSATMDFAIEKAHITDHSYFIMDTPGFDAHQQEHAFDAIVRGIKSVYAAQPAARLIGILYVTCINQPRFENLDRQLFQFVRALCGDAFVARGLVFVTTFWTASSEGQKSAFQRKLQMLRTLWTDGGGAAAAAAATPAFYSHGRGYRADGEPDGSFVDWFTESGRDQIARHAREMVARCYGDDGDGSGGGDTRQTMPAATAPRIVQELGADTPAHETEAGKLLGLVPQQPQQVQPHAGNDGTNDNNGPSPRTGPPGGPGPDAPAGSPGDHLREPEMPHTDSPSPSLWDTILRAANWFFDNVEFSVELGPQNSFHGATGRSNIGQEVLDMPGFRMGTSYNGPLDALSVVDVCKSFGMDSSREARLRYGRKHGIQGVPLSAEYNNAMRRHILEHHGRRS